MFIIDIKKNRKWVERMQKLKNNVKIVGKYNITFFDAYDKKVPYQGITVEEFDKNDKFIEGSKKRDLKWDSFNIIKSRWK